MRTCSHTYTHTTRPWATSPPTNTPTSNALRANRRGGSGWVASFLFDVRPVPYGGPGCPAPPWGAGAMFAPLPGGVARCSVDGGQWVPRRSVALGARRCEAGAGWLSSGAHGGYICGTRTVCVGGAALHAPMHVTPTLVRGRHTRPWSWPMALWLPHAVWGRGLTHGGRERSQRAVRGS